MHCLGVLLEICLWFLLVCCEALQSVLVAVKAVEPRAMNVVKSMITRLVLFTRFRVWALFLGGGSIFKGWGDGGVWG